ncbi:MAG: hypothetical protein KY463_06010 [Actinobacteria bacterium]|nr:hypothetical protein [Actinomycetota bacterium]
MLTSRSRSLIVLVLTLVAGLALLSGCGGDDAPQTKESFILEADGICESFAGEFSEAGLKDPGTPKEVADANHVLADLYERFGERLSDVELPASGAARTQAQAYVNSVRRSEPLLDRLREASDAFLQAAEGTDRQALSVAGNNLRRALDAFRATRAASDRLAVAYGLNLCGNLD